MGGGGAVAHLAPPPWLRLCGRSSFNATYRKPICDLYDYLLSFPRYNDLLVESRRF